MTKITLNFRLYDVIMWNTQKRNEDIYLFIVFVFSYLLILFFLFQLKLSCCTVTFQ